MQHQRQVGVIKKVGDELGIKGHLELREEDGAVLFQAWENVCSKSVLLNLYHIMAHTHQKTVFVKHIKPIGRGTEEAASAQRQVVQEFQLHYIWLKVHSLRLLYNNIQCYVIRKVCSKVLGHTGDGGSKDHRQSYKSEME